MLLLLLVLDCQDYATMLGMTLNGLVSSCSQYRHIASNFRGQGRFLKIRAQILHSSFFQRFSQKQLSL